MSVAPVGAQQAAAGPGKAQPRVSEKELRAAAAEFESLFINQMMKSMRESIGKSELFHGGNAEEIYTSMLDTELSKNMAKAGGIGLANMLLRQLSDQGPEALSHAGGPAASKARLSPRSAAPAEEPATASVPPAPIEAQEEGFSFPVREMKRISSAFGERKDPFTGKTRFHHGMDIAAESGTPVYPASSGKVIFSGRKGGYGNMVEVLHENGIVTRYGHNAENAVKEGDTVSPSQPIAFVGSTGRSTGPHLHFEVLRQGKALDPESLYV
ncbi:Murein DD-endopeptidase MepM [uncultured bacterium]|nr:Murein DD-endopeptidase MepM [uncultured bacterium]